MVFNSIAGDPQLSSNITLAMQPVIGKTMFKKLLFSPNFQISQLVSVNTRLKLDMFVLIRCISHGEYKPDEEIPNVDILFAICVDILDLSSAHQCIKC